MTEMYWINFLKPIKRGVIGALRAKNGTYPQASRVAVAEWCEGLGGSAGVLRDRSERAARGG